MSKFSCYLEASTDYNENDLGTLKNNHRDIYDVLELYYGDLFR